MNQTEQHKRTGPQTGKDRIIRAAVSPDLTPKQIWERAGKICSLSHVYYILRTRHLKCTKHVHAKQFSELAKILEMDTKEMTVTEIMRWLKLTGRTNYHRILNTLIKNSVPFTKTSLSARYEERLSEMDTANMTIIEIAKQLGMTEKWQTTKLYPFLKRIGLAYKKKSKD